MKLKGKRVLVTGAAGFIGSHLVARLVAEGCTVKALTHYDSRPHRGNLEYVSPDVLKAVEVIAGDVRDAAFMRRIIAGQNVVFHLAALIGIPYSYVAPASYVDTNVLGTLNVLEAAVACNVERVVHTSTSECYGTAQYTPIDELHPLKAQSPYAATKIAADKLAESFYLTFKLPVTTIRPFNTFGPRQSARAVIPSILSQLLSGRPELTLGSLSPVRDLNFVENTVDGFVALASHDETVGQLLNVGSGRGVTIGETAALAMKAVGREVPIKSEAARVRPESSEVMALICNHDRVSRLTNWAPRVSLEAGLQKTAEFIQAHLDLYRPEEYCV